MTETVSLHKDKNMKIAKAEKNNQPVELDLWQMMISDKYSNSARFYQALPDVFS